MSLQATVPEPMDERTARWYVDKYGEHISQALTIEIAQIGVGDMVLDIGCGSGHAARMAAALVGDGRVVGIDPSLAMLCIARDTTHRARADPSDTPYDRIEFREGAAESMPVPDGSVAVALAINSIHHWYDLGMGLREAARVLAPGGRLVIAEERLSGGRFGHGQGPTAGPESVAGAMRDAGFIDVRIKTHARRDDAILYVEGTAPNTSCGGAVGGTPADDGRRRR